MKMPISEICDRYSIAILKKKRAAADNDEEIHNLRTEIESYQRVGNLIYNYIDQLVEINGRIWDLESDIRRGREGELGLEEVGKRALHIRDLNKQRVKCKNELVDIFNEGYKDIKINHASGN